MRIVEIRDEASLLRLRPEWAELLRQSGSDTIFLTWEWLTAWWSAYGVEGELRIFAAYDEAGVLKGIAPLRSRRVSRYGQTVSTLSFAVDGSNDSDYLDFIIASGYEAQVLEAFQQHWKAADGGQVLLLNEIPEVSPNLALLRQSAAPSEAIWTETDVPCGTVPLPQSWDEYLSTLRSRFRTKVRSVLRELEGRAEVRFGFCTDAEEVRRMLPILFDLHTRRWVQDGKPGVFGWAQKREFYGKMAVSLFERGWLRFSYLEWKGRVLACQFGFAYSGKYFLLQEGYEPASEHLNLGVGLRAWSIREFQKEGLREYDFLAGRILRHRSDWGAVEKQSKQVQVARRSYRNLLFCCGAEVEEKARESVKRLIPEKILAARHERLQAHPATTSGATGLQNVVARGYFNFGLSAVARPFRDRYQLIAKRDSRLPKLTVQKRKVPTARILYYHRINDDGDSFFPSISTNLFERQIEFLSKNYKIVALGDLIGRLDGDSPEPVIAITFDDGYRDNFEAAFPILQKYRVPATVFLTTGGLDTGNPLWFERLALALKKTTSESIDVGIDIPRRFWTRTEAERLASNGGIYELLRVLPDAERQAHLTDILTRLGLSDESEKRNKMLTWDQVRQMKAAGIDFGGHTVTHPFVSRLTPDRAVFEVSECKRRIEEELQVAVTHFAYPSGREQDMGSCGSELLKNAGYRAAVSTVWGINDASTDRMQLRRGGPWEEDLAQFAYKMDWYQLANA